MADCSKQCNFSGKVVIVTGSSSGIGAASAILFARLGASVVITGRNVENLKKVELKCKFPNVPAPLVLQADLTNESEIKKIVDCTLQRFGKIDVLINNAGIFEAGTLEHSNLEQLDRIWNTNIRAVFYLTQLCRPHLIKTQGNIINISSVAGLKPLSAYLAYCMSKSALDQFTKCISAELGPSKVRVNSVNPGMIITEIFAKLGAGEEVVKEIIKSGTTMHPIGRAGQPEEVADLIAFLASDKAGFITGGIYTIDGGYCNATNAQSV